MHDVIGNILQDEKIPGIHIAFGNPYGAHTGADWYSATHIDVVGRDFDIWVDGRQIMKHGKFLLPCSHLIPLQRSQQFNRNFTPEKYQRVSRDRLDGALRAHVDFRNSETPCFFPADCWITWRGYGRGAGAAIGGQSAHIEAASDARDSA